MPSRRLLLAAVAGLTLSTLAPIGAFAATWVTLGTLTVDLTHDHDSISVGKDAGQFQKLRLKVTGNTVFVSDVKATFASKETADLPLRSQLKPGTTSKELVLPGMNRFITQIELIYRKVPAGGTAVITIEGLKR